MAADRGLRKLAAILAADVAGYSRLMADDERATVDALTEYREVFTKHVEAHQGRIVDTAGDSVLATFDSVVEAVEAGVDIQRVLTERNEQLPDHRRMHFRIGVNLGDIIVREDGTIYGDGVNVAARLESLAEPGGINVSGTAYDQVRGKLGIGYEFLGEQDVKNIPELVRAYKVLLEGSPVVPLTPSSKHKFSLWPRLATAIVLIVGVLALWQFSKTPTDVAETSSNVAPEQDPILALPTGPRIAVLPFENLSGDPEQDYFSDGLTEELITKLSRYNTVLVIARESTMRYKGQDVDPIHVANDLDAGYIVSGSLRRLGDTFRINIRLMNGSDGVQMWGDSYDRELTPVNLFAVQDEIVAKVASVLAEDTGLVIRDLMASVSDKPPETLAPYECLLRAVSYYDLHVPDEHRVVRECARHATLTNPNYPDVWVLLGSLTLDEERFGYNREPDPLLRAEEHFRRAIALDRNHQWAHHGLALVHFFKGDVNSFVAQAERALALNSNNSAVLADFGNYLLKAGQRERGVALVRKAMAINPFHAGWYFFPIAEYHYGKHEYQEALDAVNKINLPGFHWTVSHRAAVLGQMGHTEEAEAAKARLLELYPSFETSVRGELDRWVPDPDPTWVNHYIEGLRRAGLEIPDRSTPTE